MVNCSSRKREVSFMEQEIRRLLGDTAVMGRNILYFEELGSTNTYVKELALTDAQEGTVVIADCQTAGRGRMDRSFQSPKGKGLYLTVLLRPQLPPERLAQVTALAGMAVCGAVERVCSVRPGLKWPNDPVLNGKKVCGILTELVTDGKGGLCLVVGIGINVAQRLEDFTPEVAEMAASLEMILEKPVSRPALAAALLEELDRSYEALKQGDLEEYRTCYRRDCVNLGRPVRPMGPGGQQEARAVDIDRDFGLVVRTPDGVEKTIRSGEVSVRGLYGYAE